MQLKKLNAPIKLKLLEKKIFQNIPLIVDDLKIYIGILLDYVKVYK